SRAGHARTGDAVAGTPGSVQSHRPSSRVPPADPGDVPGEHQGRQRVADERVDHEAPPRVRGSVPTRTRTTGSTSSAALARAPSRATRSHTSDTARSDRAA